MADNRGVAYMGPGTVEVQDIDFPTFELQDGPGVNPANVGRKVPHGAILRIAPWGSLRPTLAGLTPGPSCNSKDGKSMSCTSTVPGPM